MADFPPNRCVRETYRRLARSDCRCMNAGAVQHDGKWYCWTHNPLIPDVPAVKKMDEADPLRLAVRYIRQAMGQMKHSAPRVRAEEAIEACERVGAELATLRARLTETTDD